MKELDFTFVEGDPQTVTKISHEDLDNLLSRSDRPHMLLNQMGGWGEDNQRRTFGYYIIADDNKLQGV